MIRLDVIGHLGKDAEVKQVGNNTVISFSVAHTEKFTSNGERKEKTIWVTCDYWTDKTAIAQYLKKGTQVFVTGSCEVRAYAANGESRGELKLRVGIVQLLGSADKDSGQQRQRQASQNSPTRQDDGYGVSYNNTGNTNTFDDLPF